MGNRNLLQLGAKIVAIGK
ncbi:unnamed protein product, partial [Rotaria sp. Silwood1]